jgi:hypothetical protein
MVDSYITPEERVASRKRVLGDFLNQDPMLTEQQKADRDESKRQTMAATGQQAQTVRGSPQLQGLGSLGIIQQAAPAAMTQLGEQAQARDQQDVTGAGMEQAIASARSEQAVGNTQRGLESNTQRLARAVADKAFSEGMTARELIFHENSALADYSLAKLKEDFAAGRESAADLQRLQIDLEQRAIKRKYAADEALQRSMGEFEVMLKKGNIAGAKARMEALLEEQKAALKDQIRAKAIADITAGVAGTASSAISSFMN